MEVYLPAATAAAVPSSEEKADAPRGESECVLYIDDDQSIVFLTTRILERLGYQVAGYHDPNEALEVFRASPQTFSAVITDLSMPGMSGFTLAAQMRSVRPDIPILLTSGYVRQSDTEAALAQGIREVILKPNTVSELGDALARALRECKREREQS